MHRIAYLDFPSHFEICGGLDFPSHFEFRGGLDFPSHFEFCGGLDFPSHFDCMEELNRSTITKMGLYQGQVHYG